MTAAWLAAVQNRPWPAVGAVAALAATHPFSGIQHLLVLGVWLVWRAIAHRRFEWAAVVHLGVMSLFLGYYFGYLPRLPQRVAIHSRWSIPWVLDLWSQRAPQSSRWPRPVAGGIAMRGGPR